MARKIKRNTFERKIIHVINYTTDKSELEKQDDSISRGRLVASAEVCEYEGVKI